MKKSFWSLLILMTLLSACAGGSGKPEAATDSTEKNLPLTQQLTVPSPSEVKSDDTKAAEASTLWSQILPPEQRFQVVLNSEGVLDRETGLVWERSPDATTYNWSGFSTHCYKLFKGGRWGWRPPTAEELSSLGDSNRTLPHVAPFQNAAQGTWWSASSDLEEPSSAVTWTDSTGVSELEKKTGELALVWCVRGGRAGSN